MWRPNENCFKQNRFQLASANFRFCVFEGSKLAILWLHSSSIIPSFNLHCHSMFSCKLEKAITFLYSNTESILSRQQICSTNVKYSGYIKSTHLNDICMWNYTAWMHACKSTTETLLTLTILSSLSVPIRDYQPRYILMTRNQLAGIVFGYLVKRWIEIYLCQISSCQTYIECNELGVLPLISIKWLSGQPPTSAVGVSGWTNGQTWDGYRSQYALWVAFYIYYLIPFQAGP